MAANKRPRKKYSPKRTPLAACRYAHFIPKLAVSNEPLKDRGVAEISAPYFAFIEALKAGTATEGMFKPTPSTPTKTPKPRSASALPCRWKMHRAKLPKP